MHGILCFGDSITFGAGETPTVGWVGRLKEYFELKKDINGAYNLGVNGHNSNDLLKRFNAECDARLRFKFPGDKYLIIIAIGENDSRWQGMPGTTPYVEEKQFEENIQELINKSKTYKADIVFLGLFPVDESLTIPYEDKSFENSRLELYNNIIKKKCQENNILFLDMFEIMKAQNHKELTTDGLHPNSKGYDKMFEIIRDFLEEKELI